MSKDSNLAAKEKINGKSQTCTTMIAKIEIEIKTIIKTRTKTEFQTLVQTIIKAIILVTINGKIETTIRNSVKHAVTALIEIIVNPIVKIAAISLLRQMLLDQINSAKRRKSNKKTTIYVSIVASPDIALTYALTS